MLGVVVVVMHITPGASLWGIPTNAAEQCSYNPTPLLQVSGCHLGRQESRSGGGGSFPGSPDPVALLGNCPLDFTSVSGSQWHHLIVELTLSPIRPSVPPHEPVRVTL